MSEAMTTAEELKPCPFCGGPATFMDGTEDTLESCGTIPQVYCENDGCAMRPSFAEETEDACVVAWNRRHGERTPAEDAVIRAAVAMVMAEVDRFEPGEVAHAARLLLAAEPAWGEK